MGPEEYVARGWSVFPCHSIVRGRCTCSKGINCESPGKHPRTHNGVKDSTTSLETVRSWMQRWPDSNWAVACGRLSDLVVIDIDPRKNGFDSIDELEQNRPDGPLPMTLMSSTGGAGKHLFYAYPDQPVGNRNPWLPGVDVKSDGGYVILPPSSHISGGRYDWINWGQEPTPMPADILLDITNGGNRGSGPVDLEETDKILQGVPEGQRDDTLFRAACRWRRQLGNNKQAVMTLALTAARNCDPPFPDEQAVKCVDSAFKQDHEDSFVAWQGQINDEHSLHPLTDLGNANRYVDHFGEDITYVEGWGWLVWSDIGWSRDGMDRAQELTHQIPEVLVTEARRLEDTGADKTIVKRWLKWSTDSQSAGRLSAVTQVARSISRVRKSVEDFDADDYQLACRNGVVDLRTGAMRPLDRNDLVTKNTGVIYDPTYRLPAFEKFMLDSCDGDMELVQYMQRAVGYTLTGSNAEEAFFMLSGPPASGKSTLLDGIHAAMGSYATTSQSETFMHRKGQPPPSNELARLAGMRLVSVSEIKEGESFNEAIIKQFTGGDRVTARFLYQDSFEFRPQFKLWIGTNHPPDAKDDALWRRIKKIPFRRSLAFNERDPNLKSMLRDPDVGGRAILAWAVRGAMDWSQGGLQQPATVSAEIVSYRMDQDREGQFINDCISSAPGATTPMNSMYNAYKQWCSITNEYIKRQPQFQKMMEARGISVGRDDSGTVIFKDVVPRSMVITPDGTEWR